MNYQDYSTKQFEALYTYPKNDLGAVWSKEATCFRVWAPTAQEVSLHLFRSGTAGCDDLIASHPMAPDQNGTWVLQLAGDYNGVYYTYCALLDGRWVEACDPYARASGANGKRSMVIDLSSTNPPGWEKDTAPHTFSSVTDCVIYELHIRDISANRSGRMRHKGKYLSLTEAGTRTTQKHPTGLDHIRSLGVTHVHLMPVSDFGSVDEANLQARQYNWGYDPDAYNVPEGSYATDPFDGFCRIREMKQMVHSLHQHGLSVVMDVVYNHVYHTDAFSVNCLVPGYFSREDAAGHFSNGSVCGNDTASERSMVRKFIVDSVNYWAEEFHIDGFRFDLIGLLDTQTVNAILSTVRQKHPHVLFYGEGWDMATAVTKPNVSLAIQKNCDMLPGFAFFNDTIRDTLRGSVFDCHSSGFLSGASVPKRHLFNCFCGRTPWTQQPEKVVNYISCHDNHTLHDRVKEALPQASEEDIARRCRLGAAFNLLSMGIPFFQAGEELLRTKKNAQGRLVGNSYRSPDSVNAIKWGTLKNQTVAETLDYYKGLLALRKAHPLFRMRSPEEISHSISLLDPDGNSPAAFLLQNAKEQILAAFHSGDSPATLTLPEGRWGICVLDNLAGTDVLRFAESVVEIPPTSALVLVRPVGAANW